MGWGSNLRKRENKWISRLKTGGRGDQPKDKRKNGLVGLKHGLGDQPKEKRKQMD